MMCLSVWKGSASAFAHPTARALLQLDWLIAAVGVELRAPHLVQALVLGAAEIHHRSEPEIKVAQALEPIHQALGVELRPGPFQAFDQDVGGDVALERD